MRAKRTRICTAGAGSAAFLSLLSAYFSFLVFSYQADLSIEEYGQISDTYNQDINMYTLARPALLKALSFDGLGDAHFLV